MQVTRQLELEDTANECNLEPVEGSDSEGSDGTSLKDEEWLIIDEVTDKCIHCIAMADYLRELGEEANMAELGEEVDMADYPGDLIHQLEQKEMEIGVLQIENEQLLIENGKLEQQNLELRGQIFFTNASTALQPLVHTHQCTSASALKNDDNKVRFTLASQHTRSSMVFVVFSSHLQLKMKENVSYQYRMKFFWF